MNLQIDLLMNTFALIFDFNPLKAKPNKLVKHTQTIADELFVCV